MSENKKPIKISLSTSVIVIVIIMVLSIITIYFLTESLEKEKMMIENNRDMQDEIYVTETKNKENVIIEDKKENHKEESKKIEKETNKNGIKMVQFDEDFYKIEDIALDYRECEKIKNYKDFEYDLDGDGKKDKVTVVHKTKKGYDGRVGDIDEDIYEFKLNDKTFYTEEYPHFTTIYIADLNENDKSIDVVIFDDGPSDDPNCLIFSKVDSKMKKIENLGWDLYTNKKGKLVCSEIHRATTTPEVFPNYFVLENNEIKKHDVGFSKIKNEPFTANGVLFTEDMKNIDKYWELSASPKYQVDHEPDEVFKEAGIIRLTEKDEFKVVGYHEDIDIKIELKDGRKGYLLGNHFSD